MMKKKILIFIVCYNHERFIESVLKRIPEELLCNEKLDVEILIIDDQSSDRTFQKALEYTSCQYPVKTTILYNPVNQGYGGNQKIGYYYAVQNHFDLVVLLHGDGQYAPELLPKMVQPILDDEADIVLGSRMVRKLQALKGRMPLYKWFGNVFLTNVQNFLLKSHLSEYHTGYRAFRVSALESIPYDCNSNYYDFDTEILIQLIDNHYKFKEIEIPTFYGEEISSVKSINYGFLILWATLLSRIVKLGIFYNPKYAYKNKSLKNATKLGFPSSHQIALDQIGSSKTVIDAGCGPGYLTKELKEKNNQIISIGDHIDDMVRDHSDQSIQADLNDFDFCSVSEHVDVILLLDILEHLKSPEKTLINIRDAFSYVPSQVIITSGNVAFLPIRMLLLLGQFNYGERGILDFTHTRMFTFKSLKRTLLQTGYTIKEIRGIPAPYPLALGPGKLASLLLFINSLLIKISRNVFSYQMMYVCEPLPTLPVLLKNAVRTSEEKSREAIPM